MKISKTVKGIAVGTSLAAFAAFAVPATAHASQQLLSVGTQKAKPMGEKKDDKKDDKKKKKGDKGEGSCGGDKGGEKSCGGSKDGKEKK
jgi:hypothetical protein